MEEKSDGNNAEDSDLMITAISFADETSESSNQKACEINSGRIAEKRAREKGDESCSGFIMVIRKRPRRLIRSESGIESEKEMREVNIDDTYKISLTSLEALPKQIWH